MKTRKGSVFLSAYHYEMQMAKQHCEDENRLLKNLNNKGNLIYEHIRANLHIFWYVYYPVLL